MKFIVKQVENQNVLTYYQLQVAKLIDQTTSKVRHLLRTRPGPIATLDRFADRLQRYDLSLCLGLVSRNTAYIATQMTLSPHVIQ